jgi:molecular chaperone GrpE
MTSIQPDDAIGPEETEIREVAEEERSEQASPEEAGSTEMAQAPTLEEAQAQLEAFRDRLARLQAEFQNYKKRTQREREHWREQITMELLTELLPLQDDFDRAADASTTASLEALREGLHMMAGNLAALLGRHGVEEVKAAGQQFDHNVHQGILRVVRPDLPEGAVVDVVEKGYRMGQHLMRPAKVTVAMAAAGTAGGGEPEEDEASTEA